MTRDASENEVWTYQKHATVTKSKSSDVYGTIILFGGSSGSSGFEQSSRTMTLIIKFDKNNKVMDFKSMTSATAFIEQIRQGTTKIRLNFVKVQITSSTHGRQGRNDIPIEDPVLYQNAFVKIQEAIFIRSMSK